ncbi:MAG: hypothetical protein Q8N23_01705 [Archangium sp.]|nr:hypothetical protein [Archangium sp.]MDP3151354.1 hypothetical protein [Archangium sp.]MDP3568977.1 hypothetical protein [Archangium sp.]
MRLGLIAAIVLTGCATAQVAIPPTQVADLERSLNSEQRFLRVSMFVTPFYGDATKRLVTPVAPELVRLLDGPGGKPLNPGAVERTLPAGTAVRIAKVEFPSAWVMTERVLYTPRSLVWIYLDVPGGPRNAPAVLVLRPGLKTDQEFLAELERHLTREDQARRLESFSDPVREAIRTKSVVSDMPSEALEMAWGYPDSKRIELVDTQRKETWRWGDGARTATLYDGRLTAFTGANGASSSSSP